MLYVINHTNTARRFCMKLGMEVAYNVDLQIRYYVSLKKTGETAGRNSAFHDLATRNSAIRNPAVVEFVSVCPSPKFALCTPRWVVRWSLTFV